ncbi:MAG: hypothetical protein AAF515_22260, partial [Pseudomonadota bacterium]
MFESEAAGFQNAGIRIGADAQQSEKELLAEALSPFGVARRNDALEMARLYAVVNCFENELRTFIRETLEEDEGLDWWDKLPPKMKGHAESRHADALKDSWLEGEKRGSTQIFRTHPFRPTMASGGVTWESAGGSSLRSSNGRQSSCLTDLEPR